MLFPRLSTTRLELTEIKSNDDVDNLFALFAHDSVVEYYDLSPLTELSQATKLIELFHRRIENGDGIRWAIRLKQHGALIGTCGFNSWCLRSKSAVIGYDLHPDFWGQGYMNEALGAAIAAAFSGKLACGELNRIQADTVPGNLKSESVLKKLGFQEEGLRRQAGFWKERYFDLKCFGLLRSDV
ncbi:GNAT family protein [Ferrimonas sp. YFM]|uniref:GNAT family N-acetyltransferase n=1 Tax=Ferrimonas sp. YFM TaxID=3028878 RepID=UPI0025738A19|nr:GNAT family protein [Ferrimonas sp. YFM]BDY05193.1 N-acetyltransferase [Ferrimonas sp. YFM]